VHRARRSPWWFSSDGSGRFDLPVPHGTCYLADAPLGALLEVTRGLTILSESFLAGRRLFTTTLVVERHLADLATAAAYGFGVTGELSATPDYTGPLAWAAALHAAGFDGIAYRVRHDPRAELSGIALFGRAGRLRRPPVGHSQELPADLLLIAAPFGIRIAKDLPGNP
jgi:RES domain